METIFLAVEKNSPHIISLKMIMVMYLLTLKTYQINSMIFFVNVGPKLASNVQSTGKSYFEYLNMLKNPINSSTYMKPIVEMDITKIIEKFNQNKSAGDDNIGNFIIKRVANEIVKPLTQIFNLSISTGSVPEKLKIAKLYRSTKSKTLKSSRIIAQCLFYLVFQRF